MHRENINELKYRKFKNDDYIIYENRQVIREIFNEFTQCYREVVKFSKSEDPSDYIQTKYAEKLKQIAKSNKLELNLIELAQIDIAYSIIFYGLGEEGETIIRSNFNKKYNQKYFFKLLHWLKMKPKKSNINAYKKWKETRNMSQKDRTDVINELYEFRTKKDNNEKLSTIAMEYKFKGTYEKYYGGHQFRLGHYFRHLFQSFKFLNNQNHLTRKNKYSYGKMYRAQLSTYEQALLLFNSLSTIGMKWEYTPEQPNNKNHNSKLITNYNLIKNLPGTHLYGITYKTYYKDINYESEEQFY
jgi:hypothetical protein